MGKKQFNNRQITHIKGNSTKTVPRFEGKCDIIHINGALHAHFPETDMKNMARVASDDNLLLVDDCSKSWPAVLKGVDYLKKTDLLNNIPMHVPEGWIYRGAQKGRFIGSYNTGGRQTIIFFVSNENATFIQELLELVNNAANTKLIVIIQTHEFNNTAISNVLQFPKIRILISYQHLHNWKKEISNYVEPYLFNIAHLTLAMLEGSDTYCVGNNGVTVILMGYSPRRLNNYDLILPAYIHMPITNQIISILNNRNIWFTPKIDSPQITFIKAKVNSMNNRFNISQYVHTDAFLIIDHDVWISDS
ncbi:EXTL3 [Mytilus coruscus]|uniref:EXTL3 n=1 Tax=Mytilus coruscus TaxID=42192 RepID=A0A6J8EBV2_MYTCO|nr:EXTL3 [Mytilus coruscus]